MMPRESHRSPEQKREKIGTRPSRVPVEQIRNVASVLCGIARPVALAWVYSSLVAQALERCYLGGPASWVIPEEDPDHCSGREG